jgi:hypothetical protein
MSENELDVQYRLFVVGERPLCVWGTNIQSLALEFLDNLDASYFEYLANTHSQHINEDQPREKDSQFAALTIRAAYSQALETLFALLCAAIQAPQCIHAWIDNYQPRELYSLVRKIHTRQPVHSLLSAKSITWQTIADAIFESLVMENKEKESAIKQDFGDLWSQFASQFLDSNFSNEYNSIKHGLRVRPGGFSLAIGAEDPPGIPVPKEKMQLVGKGEFGSQYLASHKIGENRHHLEMKRQSRNWSPEDLCWGLHLVSLSIANVKAALRILNGIPATDIKFEWRTDRESYQEPWKPARQIGVTSMSGFQIDIRPDYINAFSEEDILTRYKAGKDGGVKRLVFLGKEKPRKDNEKNAS